MINTIKAKWDFSPEEKYAIKWFNDHGFDGELVAQYISKTKFIVTKDGVTDRFELPQGNKDMKVSRYMEQYHKSFEMLCEITRMKAEYKRRQIEQNDGLTNG